MERRTDSDSTAYLGAAFALAAAGIAVGLTASRIAGALFVLGGVLFTIAALRQQPR